MFRGNGSLPECVIIAEVNRQYAASNKELGGYNQFYRSIDHLSNISVIFYLLFHHINTVFLFFFLFFLSTLSNQARVQPPPLPKN